MQYLFAHRLFAATPTTNTPPELTDFRVGIAGVYRTGNWTQLAATFQAGAEPLAAQVAWDTVDGDETPLRYLGPTLKLAAGETATVRDCVQIGRRPWRIKIVLLPVDDHGASSTPLKIWDRAEATPALGLASTQEWMLEVGGATGLTTLIDSGLRNEATRPVVTRIATVQELPYDPRGYDGLRGVVLTARLDDAEPIDQRQADALAAWVRSGGKLLFCLTNGRSETWSGKSPYSALVPGELSGEIFPLRDYSVWRLLVGGESPIQVDARVRNRPQQAPVVDAAPQSVVLRDDDHPLVISAHFGLGRLTFCVADLTVAPLKDWRMRDDLLRALLPWKPNADTQVNTANASARLGYNDLAGQFRTALGVFPASRGLSFWTIFGCGVVLAAVWFPLQAIYLPAAWSAAARWALIVVLIVGASYAAYALTDLEGAAPQSHLVELIDYRPESGDHRGQSWFALHTPQTGVVDVSVDIPTDRTQSKEWIGMPGTSWGALDGRVGGTIIGGATNVWPTHTDTSIEYVAKAGDTKIFSARWSDEHRRPIEPLHSRIGTSIPSGTIRWEPAESRRFALSDAVFIYEGWALEIGSVMPGQAIKLDDMRTQAISAASAITGRRARIGDTGAAYSRESVDIKEILKLMAFYGAGQGGRFTGLWNRAWERLDAGGNLTKHQAVLYGWGPPSVRWNATTDDDDATNRESTIDDRSTALYRIWIPVVPGDDTDGTAPLPPTIIAIP